MQSFEEIGLREELLRTLEEEDIASPTALQEAVVPALRRGGNVAARASAGSGKTLAYTIGVLDRLKVEEDEEGDARARLRVLVLAPTTDEAGRIAQSMVPYAQAIGLQAAVPGAGWGTSAAEAAILVASAEQVMTAVQASEIKLDDLETVVIDGASLIQELGELERVDSVLDLIPRDAQRVVFSATLADSVEDLVARRVKRALRYPSEPALAETRDVKPTEGAVGYVIASEREKFELLARQLSSREQTNPPPLVFCRSDERAADLAERLAMRGFLVGEPGAEDADVAIVIAGVSREELLGDAEGESGQTISYDVPPDARTLQARHAGDAGAVVLLEPRELAHLMEIARQARYRAQSAPVPGSISTVASGLESFRSELRRALREEDLTSQMLVLQPLLEEFTAAEVAAAASALLRHRRPIGEATPSATGAATRAPRASDEKGPPAGPAPVTWARLFVSVGSRDDVRPGDLVGALAGEADIPGARIGKIEIRESFSIVEVQADFADKVIRAVNGTTMKGRSVRVDFDRGGPARRPPTRDGAAPRRTTRRPPRGE